MIHIAIVDDNKQFCASLESVLETYSEIQIDYIFNSYEEFLESSCKNVSILLLDNHLYGENGLDYIEEIKLNNPTLKIIMLTVDENSYSIRKSLEYGASGYIVKGIEPYKLVESIQDVYNNGVCLSSIPLKKIFEEFQRKQQIDDVMSKSDLNDKELEVLAYLSRGYKYDEIAEKIYLSKSGVKYYLNNIYKRLNVRNRTEAVRIYLKTL